MESVGTFMWANMSAVANGLGDQMNLRLAKWRARSTSLQIRSYCDTDTESPRLPYSKRTLQSAQWRDNNLYEYISIARYTL